MTTKAPSKYIQASQGATTAVYLHKKNGTCVAARVIHHEPKPVLFRKARKITAEV